VDAVHADASQHANAKERNKSMTEQEVQHKFNKN